MNDSMKPPKEIPNGLWDRFTMGGRIRVTYCYRDDTNDDSAAKQYTKESINDFCRQIKQKKTFYYGITDSLLYRALDNHGIRSKKVAILGSQCPLYESICLSYGGLPTTIEYQRIISEDDRLRVMTVDEYERSPLVFDAAFSISSFEHDGLGRYGDPINPEGDLQTMKKMKSLVKKGGVLFLSVPVGEVDELEWNSHRIYGKYRLPRLLQGWKVLDIYGWREGQPVFVLENSGGCTAGLWRFLLFLRFLPYWNKGLKYSRKLRNVFRRSSLGAQRAPHAQSP